MQILGHIRINKKKWTVVKVPGLHDDNGHEVDGLTKPNQRVIEIHGSLPRGKAWEIYHHEVGHAMIFSYGLTKASWADEEDFCEMLGATMRAATKPFPQNRLW